MATVSLGCRAVFCVNGGFCNVKFGEIAQYHIFVLCNYKYNSHETEICVPCVDFPVACSFLL